MDKIVGGTITTPINTYTRKQMDNALGDMESIVYANASRISDIENQMVGIDTALDNIIALQNSYIDYGVQTTSEGGEVE